MGGLIVDDDLNDSYMYESQDSVEYKKAKKRMQNKESATRTRMKKKSYYQ